MDGGAAVLYGFGIIHSYALTATSIEGKIEWGAGPLFALSYAAAALFLLLCGK